MSVSAESIKVKFGFIKRVQKSERDLKIIELFKILPFVDETWYRVIDKIVLTL